MDHRIFYHGHFADLEQSHYDKALDGEDIYFQAFDWASGDPIWMQLCHKNHFLCTIEPPHGFDSQGFFVRTVPMLLWPPLEAQPTKGNHERRTT